jgi:fluoride ion exporter CrcB/FEX
MNCRMDDREAAVLAGLLGGLTTQSTGRVFRGAASLCRSKLAGDCERWAARGK